MKKTKVLLTGATGNMGSEGLKQLYANKDKYDIVLFSLPTKADKKKLAAYEGKDSVTIVWGDLTNYEDVKRAVDGVDIVLHVGGMVSPKADYHPALTMKVNVGGIRNIIKAIKAQKNADKIKLVYIGSIAQTGDRSAPIHWGRTGDPIKISIYDNYAISKTIAEREVIESGLNYWVSLRQTGILYPGIGAANGLDPIMFHTPMNNVIEWVTAADSGKMLANVCKADLPEDFWRRIYNVGGGEKYRTTYSEFMIESTQVLGIKDFKKVTDLNWFATGNFHGQWYEDSDVLEEYLHFRSGSLDGFIAELKQNVPFYLKLTKLIPSFIMKNFAFKPAANKPAGTMNWINNNNKNAISAFFGSKEKWEAIPAWSDFKLEPALAKKIRLNHGYDESKPKAELDIQDLKQATEFRGGKCLSEKMEKGDLYDKLAFKCAFGHEFEASPALILLGGHWCPDCLPTPWNYDAEAKRNPFFAQVWYPLHDKNEANYYEDTIYK
ncbi:NAD(P)-dependent oxidoreductase [Putridiphycobacter roseus]|uniref:NAD(P)-dependent oxidoreductase n=1 Tax=Putridiphycobacter roseus TaxID=2219161 RepID=A0A2W1MYP3_9FLAO|nr:NAD-dependent epimerase/dehydratase family protein [Putridiphycobacter roseus]PZE15671.1 NAD(P)-dependent oxidoreductase [Putridiphycobacter roseus]